MNKTNLIHRAVTLARTFLAAIVFTSLFATYAHAQNSLVWAGSTASGAWDTTTQNWALTSDGTPATFANGDSVLFDNSTTTTTVTIPSAVSPSAITVNATRNIYFTPTAGAGEFTGNIPILKQGTGMLIFTSTFVPAFTGTTTIEGGVFSGTLSSSSGTRIFNFPSIIFAGGTFAVFNNKNGCTVELGAGFIVEVPSGVHGVMNMTTQDRFRFQGTVAGSGTLSVNLKAAGVGTASCDFRNDFSDFHGELRIVGSATATHTWSAGYSQTQWVDTSLVLDSAGFFPDAAAGNNRTIEIGALGSVNSGMSIAGNRGGTQTGITTFVIGAKNLDTTYQGTIDGAYAALTKVGTGMLTLADVNTYSGTTTVTAGALRVTGQLANTAEVTVADGALLGGSGTITSASVTYDDGATLLIDADASGALSTFEIIGAVTAGGALKVTPVVPEGVELAAGTYTILHATSIAGIADVAQLSWEYSGSELSAAFAQGADNISLTLTAAPPALPVITSPLAASGTVGVAFNYTITGSNSPTAFDATGLPDGLDVDHGTGVIDGSATESGLFNVLISTTNAAGNDSATLVLTMNAEPTILTQPEPTQSVFVGQSASFTVSATGYPEPTYLWSQNGTAIAGATLATYTINPVTLADSGTYTVAVTNAEGSVTSDDALLTVSTALAAPSVTTQPAASQTVLVGASVDFTAEASGNPAPTYQWSRNGTPITSATFATYSIASAALADSGTYVFTATNSQGYATSNNAVLTVNPLAPIVTSAATATGTMGQHFSYTVTADNNPESFNATGYPAGLNINTTSGLLDGTPTVSGSFAVTITATNVTGSGTATLGLAVYEAPAITTQPAPTQTVDAGDSVSFTAAASGYPAPTYLWSQNGTAITSATLATYTIASTVLADAGTYTVTASNAAGTATSNNAQLTVNELAPVITSELTANGMVGVAFTYTITGSNNPTSFNVAGLPAGLDFGATTGIIDGTPTVSGTSNVSISAINSAGSDTKTLELVIAEAAPLVPTITSALNVSATIGVPFSYFITADNSPTAFEAAPMPAGLSLVNATTGEISGTPTALGITNIILSATNSVGSETATLRLAVVEPAPVDAFVWTGSTDNIWDKSTTSENWIAAGMATHYQDGDKVLFNDASTTSPVSITEVIAPASVTVDITRDLTLTPTGGNGLSGNMPLLKKGTGMLNISATNAAFTGTVTVEAGVFKLGHSSPNNGGFATGPVVLAGGTLSTGYVGSRMVITSTIVVPAGKKGVFITPSQYRYSGAVVGSGTLVYHNLPDTASRVTELGTDFSNFHGELQLTGTGVGNVRLAINDRSSTDVEYFPANSWADTSLVVNSGTVTPLLGNSYNGVQPIGALSGTGQFAPGQRNNLAASNGKLTFQIGAKNIDTVFGGEFTGANISIEKVGTGMLTLAGANTYTGTTTVTSGALHVTGQLDNTPVTVSGTAAFGGSGTVGGMVTFNSGATLLADVKSSGALAGPEIAGAVYMSGTLKVSPVVTSNGVILSGNYTLLHSVTGITGTPVLEWVYSDSSVTAELTKTANAITVEITAGAPQAPIITSATTANGVAGDAFTYTITATNNPASFNATGLPSGLGVNTTSGVISGTLAYNTVGTSTITISAANLGGFDEKPLVLTIAEAPTPTVVPVISGPLSATGIVGTPFSYQIHALPGPILEYTAEPRHAGLSVNSTSGLIDGTPTASGVIETTLGARNAAGTGNATLRVTIYDVPVITSATTATAAVNELFTYEVTAHGVPTSYDVTGLPAWLTFDSATRTLSGTPTAASIDTVTITVTNPAGTDTKTLRIQVTSLEPWINEPLTATGTVGLPFSYQINATNSPTAYDAAPMPAGLSFDSGAGIISGTPTEMGATSVALAATNAHGTGTATLTLSVVETIPTNELLWTGAISDTWDKTTENWTLAGTPAVYQNAGKVYFNDSSLEASGTVNIPERVEPASVTFAITTGSLVVVPAEAAGNETNGIWGSGTLHKKGQGTVHFARPNMGYVGNTLMESGVLSIANTNTAILDLCLGPILFTGGTVAFTGYPTGQETTLPRITVPEGHRGELVTSRRFNMTNPVLGSGTLVMRMQSPANIARANYRNDFAGFHGTLLLSGTGVATFDIYGSSGRPPQFNAAGLIDTSLVFQCTSTGTTPMELLVGTTAAGNTVQIGALTGDSMTVLRGGNRGMVTYSIGAKNLSTTYAGSITNSGGGAALVKTGTGMLTLTGTLTLTGSTAVNSGAMLINGEHTGGGPITVAASTAFGGSGHMASGVTFAGNTTLLVCVDAEGALIGPKVGGDVSFGGALTVSPIVPEGSEITNGIYTIFAAENEFGSRPTLTWSYPADPAVQAVFEIVSSKEIQVTITGAKVAKPHITSALKVDTMTNTAFSYTLTATQDITTPTILDATDLPPGLSFNAATGVISGQIATAGRYTITIAASNSSGTAVEELVVIAYDTPPPLPVITSSTYFVMIKDEIGSYAITADNDPTHFDASGLPDGLSINAITGVISGKPTTLGTSTVTLGASNIGGRGTATLELVISLPRPVITSPIDVVKGHLPNAVVQGEEIIWQIAATNSPTRFQAYVTPAEFSASFIVDGTTGLINARFDTIGSGTLVRMAFNVAGQGTGVNTTIYVNPRAPVITDAPEQLAGVVGVPFNFAISASNMIESPNTSAVGRIPSYGATGLPKGLTLDMTTGVISGTPVYSGVYQGNLVAINVTGVGSKLVTFVIAGASAVVTLAGEPGSPGNVDGPSADARFTSPGAGVVDKDGNIYIADTGNNAIRKIATDGTVSTFVTGLNSPTAVVINAAGTTLYVSDTGSDTIKVIDIATGNMTTLAVTGTPALTVPHGLAIDSSGNLYVADTGNNSIRKIDTATGVMTTIAGNGLAGSTDAVGADATFNTPVGVALNVDGTKLYIADTGNSTIRCLTLGTGLVETIAGTAGSTGNADGGPDAALFTAPEALAVDLNGVIYVADTGNNAIRTIDPIEHAVATLSTGVPPISAPAGITIDSAGDVYVLDTGSHVIRVLQVSPSILKAPISQAVPVSTSATFNVIATGAPTPTYQWYKDGKIIAGETTTALVVNNVQLTDVANYVVVVTNPLGTVQTTDALLTVTGTSPTIPSGGGGGGGGGGAPSLWYLAGLALVAALYRFRRRGNALLFFCLLSSGLCLLPTPDLSAQAVATGKGIITGRVMNQGTGKYLSNALVTVEGTRIETITDDDGAFRLFDVPAGEVRISASYTDLDKMTKTVTVADGQTATSDFNLTAQIYQLEKFVVSGDREGSARMTQEQRMSANQKAIFAADSFGNIVDSNMGELMKNLPGITIDYDGEDAGSMRIRGMDPEFANVTLDGNEVASMSLSTDDSGIGTGSRAFNLQTQSLQNIESIELKTAPTAEDSASSMGGAVNIKTKSALSQKGRRMRFAANLSLNTAELDFDKTPGGGRTPDYKIWPGFAFSWGEAFGKKQRFGFTFNTAFNRNYRFSNRYEVPRYAYDLADLEKTDYKVTPTTPGYVNELRYTESGKSEQTRMISLNLEYQPWRNTVFFINGAYNDVKGLGAYNRKMTLGGASNTTAQSPEANLYNMIYPEGGRVSMDYGVSAKDETNVSFNAGARHTFGKIKLNYGVNYSRAETDPDPDKNFNITYSMSGIGLNVLNLAGNATGQVIQTSHNGQGVVGPDDERSYQNLENYNSLTLSQRFGYGTDERRGANIDLTIPIIVPLLKIPVEFKAGGRYGEQTREMYQYWHRRLLTGNSTLTKFGTAAEPALYQFADPYFKNSWGFDVPIPNWINPYFVKDYLDENPGEFYDDSEEMDGRYYQQQKGRKSLKEETTAAYIQFNARLLRNLTMIAGLRYERTKGTGTGPIYDNESDTVFSQGGLYDTVSPFIPGTSDPNPYYGFTREQKTNLLFTRETRTKAYENFFPNIQFKYEPVKNMNLRLARTESIGRPKFGNLLPWERWISTEMRVQKNNPELLPQFATKYDFAIEYYFPKNGSLTLSVFYQEFKNVIETDTTFIEVTNDPSLEDGTTVIYKESKYEEGTWIVESPVNIGNGKNEGFELVYRQRLGFIADWLRNFEVYGSYSYANPRTHYMRHTIPKPTKNVTQALMDEYLNSPLVREEIPMTGIQKKSATLQLRYNGQRFEGKISAFWVDKFARDINRDYVEVKYQAAYTRFDLSLTYKINSRWKAMFDWRNVTDVGDERNIFDRTGGYFTSGMVLNLGVEANF